ncbi:hypothetical protein FQN50_004521 [Emmonsiellopsis sp. PD_5]|nr:hypothetical protein FQN50_004521 [Emmonsiellopsis sp. PD_5]
MASTTDLLNGSDDSYDASHCRPATRRREHNEEDDILSEMPVLPDFTWEGMLDQLWWGDQLWLGDQNFEDILCHDFERPIEEWASHELVPSNHQSSSPELASEPSVESTKQLCYGMIHRAAVKLVGDMSECNRNLLGCNRIQTFHIKKSSPQLLLTFPNCKQLGWLESHAAGALDALIERPSIQLEAVADVSSLRETIGKVTKAKDAIIRVDICIYGSRESSAEVGRHLSNKKVYLQRPDPQRQRTGSIYDNPHVIKFPDLQIRDVDRRPTEMEGKGSELTIESGEGFQKAIQDVYDSLHRSSNLRRLEGDSRLKTALLPHQQEALDFMTQREKGPIPDEFRLWSAIDYDGSVSYVHSVTNEKSQIEQIETGGGILADEMGMGKSLSILSLLVWTLEDARNWAYSCATSSGATLIIVPSALLINGWLEEIKKHLGETLNPVKYHGKGRTKHLANIKESDIVLTTYHTITEDFKRNSSPLHDITWFRIVLDEAHIIRRPSTTFHRAVCALEGNSRWCLTGTPIQNRLEDIGALFTFIRVPPFSDMNIFRKFIVQPFDESADRRVIASKRLGMLIDSLCLRRTKEILHLPEPKSRIISITFSDEERQQYERTKRMMTSAIRQQVGDEKNNVFGVFQAQLQLRILCNHGTFQHPFSWARARRRYLEEREDALWGTLALVPMFYAQNVGTTARKMDEYFRSEGHSSKIAALVADVQQDLWQTKRTLDLIAKYLNRSMIPFTRIDGECTLPRRQEILNDFSQSNGKPVLIMTTGTGAIGLNLASANRVFIVEPQWNPSVENQAVARAMRLGQGQSVLVTRYVVDRTVEMVGNAISTE